VICGDAGTKFFHANATIRHRKNLITTLEDNLGIVHTDHQMKAAILWEAFKNRLGHSDFASMSLDLGLLLQPSPELLCLDEAFSNEEIDHVVANLPSD
jgi:hypothetical protein